MPKKKSADSKKKDAPEPSFEEAMERIESIVGAMESDSLTLEKMLENYEEGSKLLQQCQERIDAAQNRIEMIASARENGAVTLKEFNTEEETRSGSHSAARAASSASSAAQSPKEKEADDEIRLF